MARWAGSQVPRLAEQDRTLLGIRHTIHTDLRTHLGWRWGWGRRSGRCRWQVGHPQVPIRCERPWLGAAGRGQQAAAGADLQV